MVDLLRAISPELKGYYEHACANGRRLGRCDASEAAEVFRAYFGIPCPFTEEDAVGLIEKLGYKLVYFRKGMEEETHYRGKWEIDENDKIVILIEQDRPPASQVKTLLHEIIEGLIEYSYLVEPSLIRLTLAENEEWCNRFAAMVKMPPVIFRKAAIEYGLDHRLLALHFKETLAGVSRQIRDIVLREHPYYFGRFEPENNPRVNCPKLQKALQASNGLCVRIWDTVKTKTMGHRGGNGRLPIYNIGTKDHYHIIHPAIRPYIEDPKPIFIPSLVGGAGYETTQRDLFNENHLAVLIFHYGLQRTQGFFLLAVALTHRHLLDPQIDAVCLDRRPDIDWLFSWISAKYDRPKKKKLQKGLVVRGDDGEERDMDEMDFLWPGLGP